MTCRVEPAPTATMAPIVSAGLTGSAPTPHERRERVGLAKELSGVQVFFFLFQSSIPSGRPKERFRHPQPWSKQRLQCHHNW